MLFPAKELEKGEDYGILPVEYSSRGHIERVDMEG
jgi:hypothetical protein